MRERGINRVGGGNRLELARTGYRVAVFLELGIASSSFINT